MANSSERESDGETRGVGEMRGKERGFRATLLLDSYHSGMMFKKQGDLREHPTSDPRAAT